jgi:hypothetical protein
LSNCTGINGSGGRQIPSGDAQPAGTVTLAIMSALVPEQARLTIMTAKDLAVGDVSLTMIVAGAL